MGSGLVRKASAYLSKLPEQPYGVVNGMANLANYVLDSWWAKIDERNASAAPAEWFPADPHAHIRECWLGCQLHAAVTLNRVYPAFTKAHTAYAFTQLFSGDGAAYRIVPFVDQYKFRDMVSGSYQYRVQSEQLSVALGQQMTLPVYGTFFVENAGTGAKLIVNLDLCHESPACVITVMACPGGQSDVEAFFADVQTSLAAHDIYYRQCLLFERGRLDFVGVTPTSWSDVVLKEDVKDQIRKNTVEILANMGKLDSLGLCPSQNMILISPPGMAKTTIFRAISCEADGGESAMTRIWCTGKSIESPQHVTMLFEAARSLAPCLVFIEDMDLFGRERGSFGYDGHVLNEFLACLDGMNQNKGVVVMASTNDIASMDEALVDRPGRFDMKVEMPLPDAQDRSTMLRSFLMGYSAKLDRTSTPESWKILVDMTDGLTGAYVKSLVKAAVIRAVAAGRGDGGSAVVTAEDLNAAAEQVMRNFAIGKKAKRHHVDLSTASTVKASGGRLLNMSDLEKMSARPLMKTSE